jgi:Domain of unknown function (DUF4352)
MNLRMRLLPLVVLIGLLAVLCLSSCGGGGTTTVTVTSSDESTAEASSEEDGSEETAEELHSKLESELEESEEGSSASDDGGESSSSCDEKGINSTELKEGRCESEGTTFVVVNHGGTLKMKTMEVDLLGVKKAKTLSSDLGSETASGTYVSFKLKVTNLTHTPVEWESEQSFLYLDENEYSEDFEVQNGIEQQSVQWKQESIQPDNTVTGTVTFDVPEKVLKKLYSEGNLDFVNFGEAGYYSEEAREIGTIRTYH